MYLHDFDAPEIAVLPDDIGLTCFALRSRMAARAVTRAYNDRLRPLNLQCTQFALLVAVRMAGAAPIAALAERLDIEPSALQRNLKLLEARGLVAGRGGRGRNGRRLDLTPEGEALLAAAAPLWAQAQADMAARLGEDPEAVRATLGRVEAAALDLDTRRTP